MSKVDPEQVTEIFELWRDTYRTSRKGIPPQLTEKRKTKIRLAIENYGFEVARQAVLGLQYSGFHMGDNREGRRWDELELILRDGEHIERFANLYLDEHREEGESRFTKPLRIVGE